MNLEDKPLPSFLLQAPVLFGLEAQGHIPMIEKMLKEGATWEEIGKEIGWQSTSAEEDYERYVEARSKKKK